MKILYAGMKYDYGIPERGFSFEHYNFYESLNRMGHTVEYFDFMTLFRQHGSRKMTELLMEKVKDIRPDLLFTFLYTDQFDPEILTQIKEQTSTVTFNWFADDHWRFESFTQHWAKCFSFVSTTDIHSLKKYEAVGYRNVLLTQWGVNHHLYVKKDLPLTADVSFVGQAHGERQKVMKRLRDAGVALTVRGTHWNLRRRHIYARKLRLLSEQRLNRIVNATRITQEEMIDLFSSSRINLNLTASSQTNFRNQIKGRTFEIPGCGGFLLSEQTERMEEFFIPDKEIACFSTEAELLEKIRYYLSHEEERQAIADAGYRRVLKDHTYEQRYKTLFRQMGLE